ncbi:MAG: hypothetical protein QNJ87_13800 [Gammaproteobacteria bacterium]|nr:hypothetical protein [Gammaproteobacteria bacterium]MDJ0890548.1 hypothetical protein [Gammaproteobacteria bacterium]
MNTPPVERGFLASLSTRDFQQLKWSLSALSAVLTIVFVVSLEAV